MKKTINFEEKDVIEKNMDEEEVAHAKKYIGTYTFKSLSFGEQNEAQYNAVRIVAGGGRTAEVDSWKFRFNSMIFSIIEAPEIGKRSGREWGVRRRAQLEQYIYDAPSGVGNKLLDASDEVNGFAEEDIKNL